MKTTLDKWETVLLALYASVVGGHGFNDVEHLSMGMTENEFGWTLYILQMRGMIEGCKFKPPRPDDKDHMMGVIRSGLLLTPKGFEKAEEMLQAQNDAGRLREVRDILLDVGSQVMANIVSKFMGL